MPLPSERNLKKMQEGILSHTRALFKLYDRLDEYMHQCFFIGSEIQFALDDMEKDIEGIEDRLNDIFDLFDVPQRHTERPTKKG